MANETLIDTGPKIDVEKSEFTAKLKIKLFRVITSSHCGRVQIV